MSSLSARPYEEPAIVEILVLTSFLFLSNAVDYVLNRLLYCGLVGQILVGVAWGTPGGNLLPESIQDAVTQFGYLGLIMIVYEGGLATDLRALRGDLALSLLVALIGTSVPIALSFTLRGFLNISSLQAFAAGASLCSTSLGTTFTVLSASGLGESRLGVVLTSAAMMDDVVGLIMSGVIAKLGTSLSSFSPVTVIRPVFVSLAFAVLLPLLCRVVVKPLTLFVVKHGSLNRYPRLNDAAQHDGASLCQHTLVLLGMVTGASYAGTSELFAAYLAGVAITWWDGVVCAGHTLNTRNVPEASRPAAAVTPSSAPPSRQPEATGAVQGIAEVLSSGPQADSPLPGAREKSESSGTNHTANSGRKIYGKYFEPATRLILRPFFFASIGFAIPITRLFSGNILWRGVVYAVLMIFAKLVCGLALVRFTLPKLRWRGFLKAASAINVRACWPFTTTAMGRSSTADRPSPVPPGRKSDAPEETTSGQTSSAQEPTSTVQSSYPHMPTYTSRIRSLYPAALLGSAMVARGEIGFLISSIAETDGIFNDSHNTGGSGIFLVTTWAILICTIIGPVAVGALVRRVRRLQKQERQLRTGKEDPLGPWGIRSY